MCAARIDSVAREKAVRKPNEWSMKGMSLSIVFGTPTIAIRSPRSAITPAISCAPCSEPSPPITNRTLTPTCSRQSTISSGSWRPRELPRIVPPSSLMPLTTSASSSMSSVPVAGDEALVAVAEADDAAHAVVPGELHHEAADDVVEPGAEPAAGDDPDPRLGRVEEDLAPRAAGLEAGQLLDGHAARAGQAGGVVEQHAVARVDLVVRAAPEVEQLGQRRVDPALAQRLDPQLDAVELRRRLSVDLGQHEGCSRARLRGLHPTRGRLGPARGSIPDLRVVRFHPKVHGAPPRRPVPFAGQ